MRNTRCGNTLILLIACLNILALSVGEVRSQDVQVTINDITVMESINQSAQVIFTVSVSASSPTDIFVDYSTEDGTAVAGSDYLYSSGTVWIPAEATSEIITILLLGDTEVEPDESFYVNLFNPVNAVIQDNRGEGTIMNSAEHWIATHEDGGRTNDPKAIAVDSEGYVYVAGNSQIPTDKDIFVVKYDSSGVPSSTWPDVGFGIGVRNYGTPYEEQVISAIELDATGNLYVTGYAFNGSSDDYLTLKYDAEGNLSPTWPDLGHGDGVRVYNGFSNLDDKAASIAVDADRNVYVTGSSESETLEDYTTIKYDSDGFPSVTWPDVGFGPGVRRFNAGGSSRDTAVAVAVDMNGYVYVSGSSNYTGPYGFLTLKYDAAGDPSSTWPDYGLGPGVRQYTSWSEDVVTSMAVDPVGNIYVTGRSGPSLAHDYETVKYEADGSSWSWSDVGFGPGVRRYDGPASGNDEPVGVVLDAAGNVYISGTSRGVDGTDDFATLKYDSGGNLSASWRDLGAGVGVRRFNAGRGSANGIIWDGIGNVCITGIARGDNFSDDYFTVKYDGRGDPGATWIDAGAGTGIRRFNSITNDDDYATAITADANGNIYVTGRAKISSPTYDAVTIKYLNRTPVDTDNDSVADVNDNCPTVANPDQLNWDSDGLGDACDPTPFLLVDIADATVTETDMEGNSIQFQVSLSGPSQAPVEVGWYTTEGTARSPYDYVNTGSAVFFDVGETRKTISVPITGDDVFELNEEFHVVLHSPQNTVIGDGNGAGTILDNDNPPVITVNDVVMIEATPAGTSANFIGTLSSISGADATVEYATTNGTATSFEDYSAATGICTIPTGQLSCAINISITGDALHEATTENFFVDLSNPVNAVIGDGQGTGTIINAQPGLSINDVVQVEGNSGTRIFTFTVTASFAYTNTSVEVNYSTQNGTATNKDYTPIASTKLVLSANSTAGTINVSVKGEKIRESNEIFFVNLLSPVRAAIVDPQGVGTILNDD